MVCIAAFIILALIGVFVAIISIFKPKVGKEYLKLFKKAWGCVGKKVRLQKCETGFKEDVKNTILSRVIIKHPKWTKPLSIIMEIVSVLIVIVFVWAVLTSIKSLLALYSLGTCNVTKPEACSLGAEVCSIDEDETNGFFEGIGRWFTEWGEIFEAIPDKFKTYKAEDFGFSYITASEEEGKPDAVDILDPGCSACLRSYINQKESGFFDNYNVRIVPFAIQGSDDSYKFRNSEIIVRYIFASEDYQAGLGLKLIDKVYSKDEEEVYYQNRFNSEYDEEEAEKVLVGWLREFGLHSKDLAVISDALYSDEMNEKLAKNRELVEKNVKVKGIPTMIYDGKRHTGVFKSV